MNEGKAELVSGADFLTAQQRKEGQDESARLNALPVSAVWLGQRAIAYVKAHPDDKDGAEALALTVKATRYGCNADSPENGQRAVSKEAFEMLHRVYPKSEWTAKTKYYY